MSPLVGSPSVNVMSSISSTSRPPKPQDLPGVTSHTQARQFQTCAANGGSQQSFFDFTPNQMQATTISVTTPTAEGGKSPSGYFGFVVDKSDPAYGNHAKKNWSPASSSIRSAAARSPLPVHVENPATPFQIQSEALAHKLQRSAVSQRDREKEAKKDPSKLAPYEHDYFSPVRTESPAQLDTSTEVWSNLSAPTSMLLSPGIVSPTLKLPGPRASTLPNPPKAGDPGLISAHQLSQMIKENGTKDMLLLDVRTYKLFSVSRVRTAVNLCIPTTLLKRPSFNVSKLSDTFANSQDKERFEQWKQMKHIVVYDVDSKDTADPSALAALHTLNKFSREGWGGSSYILKGGFNAFASACPELVDEAALPDCNHSSPKGLSLKGAAGAVKGAGGVFNCPLPVQQSVVNPFFSNIRQNMDLIDGVGEIPVSLPSSMRDRDLSGILPAWLSRIVSGKEGAKIIADRFLKIEKAEQRRMQEALNVSVVYDSPTSTSSKPHTLAGVEKGNKNRYNNIWPYDHSRVKLQEYPVEECDYVNASHVYVPRSQKRYIASQAPLPSTFRDFWCMIWEQDVRVIVMLTAEEEGGRLKSHKYWETNEYGPLKLTKIQERKVSLEPSSAKSTSPKRRSLSNSSNPSTSSASSTASSCANIPYIVVRKFTLEHTGSPFTPIREITQLQYSAWPDLGAPAHPSHVLGIVEHTDAVVRAASGSEANSRRPVLVHCSAGCGRTGTFCTIDSVINMLKRQRSYHRMQMQHPDEVEGDIKMNNLGLDDDAWISKNDEDLVFQVVSEFRDQRISMVQCLQQYVLCYETVLEWLSRQSPIDGGGKRNRWA